MKTLDIRKFLKMIFANKQQPTAFLFEGFSSSAFVIAELWACGEITFWPCLFSMGGWLRFRSHRGGCVGYFNELPASEWWIGVSELSVCSTPSEGSTTRVLVSRALCFPHTITHTHTHTQRYSCILIMNPQQTHTHAHGHTINATVFLETNQKLRFQADEKLWKMKGQINITLNHAQHQKTITKEKANS